MKISILVVQSRRLKIVLISTAKRTKNASTLIKFGRVMVELMQCLEFMPLLGRFFRFNFNLLNSWLKAKGLPVACGKFKQGETIPTSNPFMLSHQVHLEKISSQGSYMIYPRKGEIWALFKGWKFDPKNHKR